MIAVISDANIIIDLLHSTLFADFLRLSWEKHVPPGVVDEVREDDSTALLNFPEGTLFNRACPAKKPLIKMARPC